MELGYIQNYQLIKWLLMEKMNIKSIKMVLIAIKNGVQYQVVQDHLFGQLKEELEIINILENSQFLNSLQFHIFLHIFIVIKK